MGRGNAAVKVIIDNRERNPELIEGLYSRNVDIEFAQLPAGDYIVSDRIGIERKTESDFSNSIIDGRLFDQLDRLRQSFERPVLVIESDANGFTLGESVRHGSIAKICTDGVTIISSRSAEDTANLIYFLARREQEEDEHEPRLVGVKRANTMGEWQLMVIGSLPGVGPKIARSMLERFKSIRSVANARPEELMKVSKIGKKKANSIYAILNGENCAQEQK